MCRMCMQAVGARMEGTAVCMHSVHSCIYECIYHPCDCMLDTAGMHARHSWYACKTQLVFMQDSAACMHDRRNRVYACRAELFVGMQITAGYGCRYACRTQLCASIWDTAPCFHLHSCVYAFKTQLCVCMQDTALWMQAGHRWMGARIQDIDGCMHVRHSWVHAFRT
jgi:hypothetical protein